MTMEKRNVVEQRRTPSTEIKRADEDWDKKAAAEFKPEPALKKQKSSKPAKGV